MVLVPLACFLFNAGYALLSYPAGALSDRIGRRPVLIGGFVVFALIYAGFGLARHAWQVWVLCAGERRTCRSLPPADWVTPPGLRRRRLAAEGEGHGLRGRPAL